MATYSINNGGPYESTFLGNLDPNLFLTKVPNNTSQLIFPSDVRDSLYTLWDNVVFKQIVGTPSGVEYVSISGSASLDNFISGETGMKLLLGKPYLSTNGVLPQKLIEYNSADSTYPDSDVIFYNLKADDYGGGGADQQFTKVSYLAGDNSNDLFLTAPYMLAQQNVGGTAIDFTIYNEGGKLTIDSEEELIIGSPDTVITLLYGTGSTGIATLPGGSIGDVQLNLDHCDFGFVDSTTASVGNVIIMGASNSPYWGDLSINSVFTLGQVLTSGNESDGEDIILTTTDSLYLGGTGSTYARIYNDGTDNIISATSGTIRIFAGTFRLDIPGLASNMVLYTDGSSNAYWATQSGAGGTPGGSDTHIQYNNAGSFGGIGSLVWDYNNSSFIVNGVSATYAISAVANDEGGFYLDTIGTNQGFVVNDGIDDVLRLTTDSTLSIHTDTGNRYNHVFGGDDTDSLGKYTFINGTTSTTSHISLYSKENPFDQYRMQYITSAGETASAIIFSPGSERAVMMGALDSSTSSVYLGFYDESVSTFDSTLITFPISASQSPGLMIRSDSRIVTIGDLNKTMTSIDGDIVADSKKVSLGINIAPQIDFHLNGIYGVVPDVIQLESYNGFKRINAVKSSYLLFDDVTDAGQLLSRIGDNIGSQVVPFGTTIKVWNRTGGTITINHINSELGSGTYSNTEAKNIYFPSFIDGDVVYEWNVTNLGGNTPNPGVRPPVLEFVYLPISGSDIETPITNMGAAQLLTELGVWYCSNGHMEIYT